jgi:membrane protease subunit HflC
MKKILSALLLTAITGLFLYGSLFSVREGYSVIVTQWGKPIKSIDRAGLWTKWPWQKVNTFDSRINCFEAQTLQLLLKDKNPIIVTCYIAWKLDNPEMFFQSLNNEDNARLKLGDMVNSQLGNLQSIKTGGQYQGKVQIWNRNYSGRTEKDHLSFGGQ